MVPDCSGLVMDLPTLKGYTCILVVVDWFSKECRFLPFSALPSALQVAEALSVLRAPGGYPLKPGAPIHLAGMEHLF